MTHETLQDIAQQIEATARPRVLTVRELLAVIGQERRGKLVSYSLRRQLKRARLKCDPDFENAHIDAGITLTLGPRLGRPPKAEGDPAVEAPAEAPLEGAEAEPAVVRPEIVTAEALVVLPPLEEPATVEPGGEAEAVEPREVVITVRQGIPAGGRKPEMIRRHENVYLALSRMNDLDVSQLVVVGGERGMVDGIFSWQSYGKARLAGRKCETVADCLSRDFAEVREDKPLFDTVREVIRHGTVIVRARDNTLCGVVTQRDIAEVFVELSEPFLFLGQIENHLRELVERMKMSRDELRLLADTRDVERAARATRVDDLTLGELIRAIQNPEYWARLGLNHDRTIILQRLDRVREIRNKVMHFDADKLPDEEKRYLTDTRRILQEL